MALPLPGLVGLSGKVALKKVFQQTDHDPAAAGAKGRMVVNTANSPFPGAAVEAAVVV